MNYIPGLFSGLLFSLIVQLSSCHGTILFSYFSNIFGSWIHNKFWENVKSGPVPKSDWSGFSHLGRWPIFLINFEKIDDDFISGLVNLIQSPVMFLFRWNWIQRQSYTFKRSNICFVLIAVTLQHLSTEVKLRKQELEMIWGSKLKPGHLKNKCFCNNSSPEH